MRNALMPLFSRQRGLRSRFLAGVQSFVNGEKFLVQLILVENRFVRILGHSLNEVRLYVQMIMFNISKKQPEKHK